MNARTTAGWFVYAMVVCLAVMSLATPSAIGQTFTNYEYQVDDFEVSWGATSVEDGFADGTVSPWYVEEGTVQEAGGYLLLTTPGHVLGPMPAGDYQVWQHRTRATAPILFNVEDGAGDFTGTSRWQGTVPAENQNYGITLECYWDTGQDYIGIGIGTSGDEVASALGNPSGGLGISFFKSVGDVENTVSQAVAIDPTEIVGDVMLSLSYDDGANELSAAFSLDGGTTFHSPFASFASDLKLSNGGEWYLDASELQVPEPTGMSLLALGGLAILRRRRAA